MTEPGTQASGDATKLEIETTYLQENFANCPEHEAEISGVVPEWITGTLLRNGPGMFQIGPDRYNHLFDGLAYLQRFRIQNGKVLYSAKFLESEAYKKNLAAQRIVVSEFGTLGMPDPCKSLFHRYFSYFFPSQFTDNDVVNFLQAGDRVYATTETAVLNRIHVHTLDTLEQVDMHSAVAINSATAHPHYGRDGSVYNMGSSYKDYCVIKTPPSKDGDATDPLLNSTIVARLPFSGRFPSYYHSFGITENYAILPESPLILNGLKILTSPITRKPYSEAMTWHEGMMTKIRMVSLETGEEVKTKYLADPFFTFHHANAYESSSPSGRGYVVMDCCAIRNAAGVARLSLDEILAQQETRGITVDATSLYRFFMPLQLPENAADGADLLPDVAPGSAVWREKDGVVFLKPTITQGANFEFPRINYEVSNARSYRYCYGSEFTTGSRINFGNAVIKVNVDSGEMTRWPRDSDGQSAGEPVFIPRPGGSEEDDGVLLVPVLDMRGGEPDLLLFLNPRDMSELARATITSKMPFSFHAHFVHQ